MNDGTQPQQRLPRAVITAAGVFIAYGLWIAWTARGALAGPHTTLDILPAALQSTLLAVVAYGLFQRCRWAWWLGLFMPASLVLLFAAVLAWSLRGPGSVTMVGIVGGATTLIVALAPLLGAIILLLLPQSRAAFRPRRPAL